MTAEHFCYHFQAHKSESAVRREAETRIEELERSNRALTVGSGQWRPPHHGIGSADKPCALTQEDNPLVMCLVDGDGNIFSPELVCTGHTGGAQAAMLLNRGIMEHLKTLEGTPTKNPQIWLTIYCNLNGLRDTFTNYHHCSLDQYDAFVEGFNKAAPLFSIVDVGSSKEAADTKLKGWSHLHCWFRSILIHVSIRISSRFYPFPTDRQDRKSVV